MNYNDIFLNNEEWRLLKKFKRKFKIRKNTLPSCYEKLLILKFINTDEQYDPKTRMGIPLGTFSITTEGKNYIEWRKSQVKLILIKNAWIPIIVSFVTTVLTNYIIPRLPLMIELCSRILSRILSWFL